jgi:hypothetical protein
MLHAYDTRGGRSTSPTPRRKGLSLNILNIVFFADQHFSESPTSFVNVIIMTLTKYKYSWLIDVNCGSLWHRLARLRRYDLRTFGSWPVDRFVDLEHVSNRRQRR